MTAARTRPTRLDPHPSDPATLLTEPVPLLVFEASPREWQILPAGPILSDRSASLTDRDLDCYARLQNWLDAAGLGRARHPNPQRAGRAIERALRLTPLPPDEELERYLDRAASSVRLAARGRR